VGLDTASAGRLLGDLRAGATLRNLMVGNFAAVARIGTAFSILIAVGFIGRWRRTRVAVAARS
jgi:hypothetical protein